MDYNSAATCHCNNERTYLLSDDMAHNRMC